MEISEIQISYKSHASKGKPITNSMEAYKALKSVWDKNLIELQEEFKVLLQNQAGHILGVYSLSKGGVNSTTADPKLVFAVALKCNASRIIVAHNHPSGNLKASKNDIMITKKLSEAAKLLDIELLDHIILTSKGYLSLADDGLLCF